MQRLSLSKSVLAALLLVALVGGCSKDDAGRVRVQGNVVWMGNPVPSGYVLFRPDASQGNRGPQGIAWIKNGEFDTRSRDGRGAVVGKVLAQVYGYSGTNITPSSPQGDPLFAPHLISIDISLDGGEITLTVPDTVKPIAPTNGNVVE